MGGGGGGVFFRYSAVPSPLFTYLLVDALNLSFALLRDFCVVVGEEVAWRGGTWEGGPGCKLLVVLRRS